MINLDFINDTTEMLKGEISGNKLFFAYEKYLKGDIDEAVKEWEEEKDNDPKALHHLTIHYHTAAIDEEDKYGIIKSEGTWEKAFQYWHELLSNDRYWQEDYLKLTEAIFSRYPKDKTPASDEAVKRLRQDIPSLILECNLKRINLYIDTNEDKNAKIHFQLIMNSGFKDDIKAKLAAEVDKKFINPEIYDVFGKSDTDSENIKNRQVDNLKRLLKINPDSTEGIALINKIYKAKLNDLCNRDQEGREKSKFKNILNESKNYLDTLEEKDLKAACFEIRSWALCIIKQYKEAIDSAKKAFRLEPKEKYFKEIIIIYKIWCEQNLDDKEWSKALRIAEDGIDLIEKEKMGREFLSLLYYYAAASSVDSSKKRRYLDKAEDYVYISEISNMKRLIEDFRNSVY